MTSRSNLKLAKLLLDSAANNEDPDIYGRTPLALAAKRGYEERVKFVLRRGADPTAVNIDGLTPLAHAVRWGH
jgi:ankyrin repeat protein